MNNKDNKKMDNVLLGKLPNDNKTASWPVEGREAKTIQIWNHMQAPIDEELLEKIRTSDIAKSKSEPLYQWSLETALTLDLVDKDLNIVMLAGDPKTGESTCLLHSCETDDPETRIDKLIRLFDKECAGTRKLPDGQVVSNELLTTIANVVAMYASVKQEYEDSFISALNYWKDRVREHPEHFKKDNA